MPGNAYSSKEIVLCTYIARFGASLLPESRIATYGCRSLDSVKMKVQNIVAMLDEKGIARCRDIKPLSGKPRGESGRETNWPEVELIVSIGKTELLSMCKEILTTKLV